jgi:hypothetical protein
MKDLQVLMMINFLKLSNEAVVSILTNVDI